ncbi:MAG: bifunctional acetate--CoA ligase family protein/GNAT family N-acetyltransferase [Nitrospiria bacterium]
MNNRRRMTHDLLGTGNHALNIFFSPKSVAVIGATETEGSVGKTVFKNLLQNPFKGFLYPVNLKRPTVMGVKAYSHVRKIPNTVELAVIVTPAQTVPGLIAECGDAGIRGAIVISAGFKETGIEGEELEKRIFREAQMCGIRIIGPNCLGVMRPSNGFNATFAPNMARPGKVAFISQSGALCTAILDWSLREEVGFSAFISVGSILDVGWGDLIDYLADDPETKSILIYMESIGNARTFLSAARELALTKPIIVIKTGYTEEAARAATSHTGAMTGSDEVLDAAFKRCGVLRVQNIEDLFLIAEALAKQPRPKGPRLMILTNAGGPGVLATDALISTGGVLADLSQESIQKLNHLLPPHWSHQNPVDILGDSTAETYQKSVEIALKDPNSDGLLAILTPQAMTEPTQTAEYFVRAAKGENKPILASWMGGQSIDAGARILTHAGIPTFSYPDSAARIFNYMWRYSYNLKGLYETPSWVESPDKNSKDRHKAEKIIQSVRRRGRTILTMVESLKLLEAYRISVVRTRIAKNEKKAVEWANAIGYPVVLKLSSRTITHKTDVGGIQLNINSASAVRKAFRAIQVSVNNKKGPGHFLGVTVQPMIEDGVELILGSTLDPQIGPVILFGTGGILVEVFNDHSLALPPLNSVLARRMMEQTKIYAALKGVRGRNSVNLTELEQVLIRFSRLIVEQREIKEIDINPFFASDRSLLALDARVVIHGENVTEEAIPKPAIRPYPVQYCSRWKLKDGTPILIRPIRPEDEPLMVKFHETLSKQTVYFRYFQDLKLSQRVAHEQLTRICFIDYDREMILVAELGDPKSDARQVIGACRLSLMHGRREAEFSIMISDLFQRMGLGTELLKRLLQIGRVEKINKVRGDILLDNLPMQKVCEKLGFTLNRTEGDHLIECEIEF